MPPRASGRTGARTAPDSLKQRVTTPVLLQMHASECGAACLGSVLAHFGRWVPLTELREKCEVSRDGSSAASIARAARHYGLECNGLSVRADQLPKLPFPLILFWQFSHFLILEGFDGRSFYLNDPATGRRKLSAEEFSRGFSGIALRIKPGDEFTPGGARPGLFEQLRTPARRIVERAHRSDRLCTHADAPCPGDPRIAWGVHRRGPGQPRTLGRAGGGSVGRRGSGLRALPVEAPVPEAAGRAHFRDRLRPGPVAAPAPAGGLLRAPAGRRSDGSGVVHRSNREESDGGSFWCSSSTWR